VRNGEETYLDGAWNGHVVGVALGWMVDGAVSRMSRPHKGMVWPEVHTSRTTPRFLKGREPLDVRNADGCVIRYRVRCGNSIFRTFPLFGATGTNVAVVAELERRIRERVGGAVVSGWVP